MASPGLLRERSRTLPKLLAILALHRSMGGGPRTFPGGLNKWQYKRMHEKMAREKERRLLQQEKQLYQARLRSEIRAKLAGNSSSDPTNSGSAMTSKEHVKILADRFTKAGAEDLWNEDDGPIRSPRQYRVSGSAPPLDLRKLVAERRGLVEENRARRTSSSIGYLDQKREYSTMAGGGMGIRSKTKWRRNSSSEEDSEPDEGLSSSEHSMKVIRDTNRNTRKNSKMFPRFSLASEEESEAEPGSMGGTSARKKLFSVAALRNHDVKTRRRFPTSADEHSGLSNEFQEIRDELRQRQASALETIRSGTNEESLLTKWRRNSSSEEDSEPDEGLSSSEHSMKVIRDTNRNTRKNSKMFPRFSLASEEESEAEPGSMGGTSARKKLFSVAALRNHDVKTRRRFPTSADEHSGLSNEFQEIRDELRQRQASALETIRSGTNEESLLTKKRFDECGISPLTIKALTDAGYIQMTVVQEAAIPVCLDGKDVLVKAKTGTGKSATFLLPAIETVIKAMSCTINQRIPPIHVLILCPSRELAIQVAAEAKVLLKHHDGIGVQTLIGGTRFKMDQKRLESSPCQIIVATPGRLLDHIENKSGFSVRLMSLKMLILDEADHLLDLGFRKDIEKIVDSVPRQRQSLLFSATIPKEVRRVSQLVLKRDHVFVDTVGLSGVETHAKVQQLCFIAPHLLHFHLVYHTLKEHMQRELDYKVIVFCTTAMLTAFLYVLLRDLKMNVREMHSRKPQLYRTRIADEFRESKCIILVTSDVSARGMDYPDVTLVIQVGIPPDREQYIHRLGRTGREGKDGKGILLLAPWEEYFMDQIKDLPIEKAQLPDLDVDTRQKVENSIGRVDPSIKEAAYHAWLGYYNSIGEIGRDKTMLAELANQFCHSIGLVKPPPLFRKTALKMGLKDIPGIHVRK